MTKKKNQDNTITEKKAITEKRGPQYNKYTGRRINRAQGGVTAGMRRFNRGGKV